MFAYCGNCPVMYIDYSGMARNTILGDHYITSDMFFMSNGRSGGGIEPSRKTAFAESIENMIAYFSNTDPNVVLDAEKIAFYNGTMVIKVPAMNDSAFSFGIILIGPNVGAETLKHEYGHYRHLQQIGPKSYMANVVIPSLIDYWSGTPYEAYYSEPQEYIADVLGGVNRTYRNKPYVYNISSAEATTYYFYTLVYGMLGG